MLSLGCNSDDDNLNIESNCDSISEIISREDFIALSTSNYTITNVELNTDCLNITFGSSGCGTEMWEENLFSTVFFNASPIEIDLKMKLINEELCQAAFQKTVSFDLTPVQISGQNELALNIEAWNEQIIYQY